MLLSRTWVDHHGGVCIGSSRWSDSYVFATDVAFVVKMQTPSLKYLSIYDRKLDIQSHQRINQPAIETYLLERYRKLRVNVRKWVIFWIYTSFRDYRVERVILMVVFFNFGQKTLEVLNNLRNFGPFFRLPIVLGKHCLNSANIRKEFALFIFSSLELIEISSN